MLSSLCLFLGEDELELEQEPDLELEMMLAVSPGLLMVVMVVML